jgi:hypothetical protein
VFELYCEVTIGYNPSALAWGAAAQRHARHERRVATGEVPADHAAERHPHDGDRLVCPPDLAQQRRRVVGVLRLGVGVKVILTPPCTFCVENH